MTEKERISEKLVALYGEESSSPNPEGLVRLFSFLDLTDHEGARAYPNYKSPYWGTLKLATGRFLKDYADKLIKDAQECEKDPTKYAFMFKIYEQIADSQCVVASPNQVQRPPPTGPALGFTTGLLKTWEVMSPATQTQVLNVIKQFINTRQALRSVDEVVGLVSRNGATIVMYGLATLTLAWDSWVNIRRWWRGEISGKRCAKGIIDSFAEIYLGVAGGVGGAMVGTAIFPGVGTAIGGIVGGVASSIVARALFDRITTYLFDLPQSEALENAYNHLGVHHKASNHELNKAFRAKALRTHPDKGGKAEDFHELQVNFAIIKAAKGETNL